MSITNSSQLVFYLCLCLFAALHCHELRSCDDIYTCSQCLLQPHCGWCSNKKGISAEEMSAKCMKRSELDEYCAPLHSEAPEPKMAHRKNEGFRETDGQTVQLRPQKVDLYLLPGTSGVVEFEFKKANDYPVDLYYLVDFSSSMREYKATLSNLGNRLAAEMRQRTSSLQMGFGSFVDKVADPFTHTDPASLAMPCKKDKLACTTPYSFKNHMSLTNNTDGFSKSLREAPMSGNSDTPEGGFDGLLQAMVCTDAINWRVASRRIIVFCTDAPFHIAGDGKLVGVVEPNDGKCHLNTAGDYTHSLDLDYPSIAMINAKAREQSINIIFAVTVSQLTTYNKLQRAVEGSLVGVMKSEKDIVDLVLSSYTNMLLSIEVTHNATGSVSVEFSALCPQAKGWNKTRSCSQLKMGSQISFKAEIKVSDCSVPEQIIEIKPVGLTESLIVHLKVYCHCQCESPKYHNFELNSSVCGNRGNLTCGKCVCPKSHHGNRCQCEGHTRTDTASCPRGCSGRGKCHCGECRCEGHYWGDMCECDDFSCPGDCSGHGNCTCGECKCSPGWSQPSCDCPTSLDTCSSQDDEGHTKICSGRGTCICGECQCDSLDGSSGKYYKGTYCEKCVDCQVECTQKMEDCINCLVYNAGPNAKNCTHCHTMFPSIQIVPDASVKQNVSVTSNLCQPATGNEQGCTFRFVPFYQDDQLLVYADEVKTCPKSVNVLAISTGVAGGTIVLGLLILLIWKLLTTIHDKREYQKFENQRAATKWGRGDNPLYRTALTTHINPAFDDEQAFLTTPTKMDSKKK